MTNHKRTKGGLIAVTVGLVAGACLAIFGNSSRRLQEPAGQQPATDDSVLLRDAITRGGLRAAAKLKGNYVAEFNPHWDLGRFDVDGLTKGSAAVIVGRFTRKLDPRMIDGRMLLTDYEVSVEEVVKGDQKQGETIVVSLPGGRIVFEDGTSAEQTTPTHAGGYPSENLFSLSLLQANFGRKFRQAKAHRTSITLALLRRRSPDSWNCSRQ